MQRVHFLGGDVLFLSVSYHIVGSPNHYLAGITTLLSISDLPTQLLVIDTRPQNLGIVGNYVLT